MSDLVPTAGHLKQRAAHYQALADQEQNPVKAAEYRDRARILEGAAEPLGQTTAERADLTEAEKHVREGEERVARQLELIRRLDRAGNAEDAGNAHELLAALMKALGATKRHAQIIRDARNRKR